MKRLGVIKAGAMRVQVYMCYQLTLVNCITVGNYVTRLRSLRYEHTLRWTTY